MKSSFLKYTFLIALGVTSLQVQAVKPFVVDCGNGTTVEIADSKYTPQAAQIACLKANQPSQKAHKFNASQKIVVAKNSSPKARRYQSLAKKYKPRTKRQEALIKKYMQLPQSKRNAFKANNPEETESIWDLGPYAICFYASVAGGADVVEAGDECYEDWV